MQQILTTRGTARQLAQDFREKIRTGQWRAGRRVPTTRELAAQYHCSVNTVQGAFRELEASDLIERRPRVGGYVKRSPAAAAHPGASTVAVIGNFTGAAYSAGTADDTWGYRIIRGCDRELAVAGQHVAFFSYDPHDPDPLPKILLKLDHAIDSLAGALLFVPPNLNKLQDHLDRRGIPWVVINRPRQHASENFVSYEVIPGSRLVARCFCRMGAKTAVFLCDRLVAGRSTPDKYLGFMQGWLESGRPSRDVECLPSDGWDERRGYQQIADHIRDRRGTPPDAIFCSGDYLALGAARALRDHGAVVGKDTLLVSSTGLQLAAYATPPLTVLENPMELVGREAARMLHEMRHNAKRRVIGRYIPARLIVRQSCPIPDAILHDETRAIAENP